MKTAIRLGLALAVFQVVADVSAADPVRWEERPFFARRVGQPVPPPQYYATTEEWPAGTELRIRVVRCPKKASVVLRQFLGGPVFSKGVVKDFPDLAVDQVLSCKLDEKMKVGVTTSIGGAPGTCGGLEQKDGKATMKYGTGDQEMVLEVEIVGK
jgi:hypothetical protein